MSGFEIFAYIGCIVMIMIGLGVAIHAHKSARDADRRDPHRVARVIRDLNERP